MTPVEQALSDIWKNVLAIDRVGLDDHFFELGGHSMLVMRLMVAIAEQYEVQVPFLTIMRHPTIRELAKLIAELAPSLSGGAGAADVEEGAL